MRSVIWLILLFVAAVVAATMLGQNNALVSLFYGPWRLDMSLNLFLLVLLGTVAVLFGALQAAHSLLSLPTRAREWRELKRERAAQALLQEGLAEFQAARYARAQRATQKALALQAESSELSQDRNFAVQAHLIAASALHRLQDRTAREEQLALAQECGGNGSSSEGILLLSAQWAMEDRDAGRCMTLLSELPPGVARRTQALRLRLQAAQQLRRPMEGLQTARLLAKHQGFSVGAAQSLLRSLAFDALDHALDESQLERVWQEFDDSDRRDAWVLARAARRAARLGRPALGLSWLWPAWEHLQRVEVDAREQLALALVVCAEGQDSRWLPLVEQALARYGREPAIAAAAGATFAQRQLWGKARPLLEQTAGAENLPSVVRRHALRTLARIARQTEDEAQASQFDQRAAALD